MAEILSEELIAYVRHGREERRLEYKEKLDWDTPSHKAKVVKAALGMSNIRDGGVLVIGVGNDGTPKGLKKEPASKFTHDAVAAQVNEFAAPYAEVTVHVGRTDAANTSWYVVIQIQEFAEVPVVCRKDGHNLRQGAIYTRGRRIHETAEVRTEAEMREILDISVEKGIRAFYRRAEAAGLDVSPRATDRARFDAQLEGL